MHYTIPCSILRPGYQHFKFQRDNQRLSYGDQLGLAYLYSPPRVQPRQYLDENVFIENFKYCKITLNKLILFLIISLCILIIFILQL